MHAPEGAPLPRRAGVSPRPHPPDPDQLAHSMSIYPYV
jgi:hypothetical protein